MFGDVRPQCVLIHVSNKLGLWPHEQRIGRSIGKRSTSDDALCQSAVSASSALRGNLWAAGGEGRVSTHRLGEGSELPTRRRCTAALGSRAVGVGSGLVALADICATPTPSGGLVGEARSALAAATRWILDRYAEELRAQLPVCPSQIYFSSFRSGESIRATANDNDFGQQSGDRFVQENYTWLHRKLCFKIEGPIIGAQILDNSARIAGPGEATTHRAEDTRTAVPVHCTKVTLADEYLRLFGQGGRPEHKARLPKRRLFSAVPEVRCPSHHRPPDESALPGDAFVGNTSPAPATAEWRAAS